YTGPHGLDLVSGGSALERYPRLTRMEKRKFGEYFNELKNRNFLIIDVGAGISPEIVKWLSLASLPVVMANSEPTSITDAYALIKMYSRQNKHPLFLWLNQINSEKKAEKIYQRIKEVTSVNLNFRPVLLGHTPNHASVPKAVAKQIPISDLMPESPYSQKIYRLASSLITRQKKFLDSLPDRKTEIAPEQNKNKHDSAATMTNYSMRKEIQAENGDLTAYIRNILSTALSSRVTDIHFEIFANSARIRFRKQGDMASFAEMDADRGRRIILSLKKMLSANADVSNSLGSNYLRLSSLDRKDIMNFRVSFYQTSFGEHAVLHSTNKEESLLNIDRLGMETNQLEYLKSVLTTQNHGVYLFAGPASSGKTTSMYSFIKHLQTPGSKIVSWENPIEAAFDGISQFNLTGGDNANQPDSAQIKNAMFSQNPDILALDGITHQACTRIALEGALLGHQVLATFPASDSLDALRTLMLNAPDPARIPHAVKVVISQILVKRLCPYCKQPGSPVKEQAEILKKNMINPDLELFYPGTGCSECDFIGYSGRVAVFEILTPTEDLLQSLEPGKKRADAVRLAREQTGYASILENGLTKSVQGLTSPDEILKKGPIIKMPNMPSSDISIKRLPQKNIKNNMNLLEFKNRGE
ncbi:MAG: ATPase, T2SS/T4P/T4SS family, partial [Desulfovibrionales bacterium]